MESHQKELKYFLSNFNTFDENELQAILEHTTLGSFKKGVVLLKENEVTSKCYFILRGCIREYQLTDGKENTTAFFTEQQAVVSYASYLEQKPSQYNYDCLEDCELMVATREQEKKLHQQHPRLEFLTQTLMQKDYHAIQNRLVSMINSTPEERYTHLMETRPDLLQRVSLHLIASFLGITPESFSRIRKRILVKEKTRH
jgi:CRP-like cAMP-binding protein